jgi:glycosyltransferase involved in cell wall biosynthesis
MANEENTPIPRVGIDATSLLGQPTGVGVFTRELLGALVARKQVSLRAFAVSWRRRDELLGLVPEGVEVAQRAMPARPLKALWAISERGRIERFVPGLDVVHGTNFTVPPSRTAGRVVTVHDLTCVRFPEMCQRDTLKYPVLIKRALKHGAVVHTPSHYVANEVCEYFGVGHDRVVAIHSGIPQMAESDAKGARDILGDTWPYILSIGTAEPRKDLPGLVAAFDALAEQERDLRLVLVGPQGWGSGALDQALATMRHRDRVVQTGFVSDGILSALIRGARTLAYPSIYEGFGFPPLSAMAAGVPVVATKAGSLDEILGGAALMVRVGDTEALSEALAIAATDEAQRSILIAAGTARTQDFSWDLTAASMEQLYRRVASS